MPKKAHWPRRLRYWAYRIRFWLHLVSPVYEKGNWNQHIRVHEAGHAVAGYLHSDHLKRIYIHRNYLGKNHLQGNTKWVAPRNLKLEYPRGMTWYIPQSVKRGLFNTAAGEIAEYWFFGRSRYFSGDWIRTLDFMRSYVGNRKVADQCWGDVRVEAVDWFAKARYMKAVAALANALKKKSIMSGREAEKIIRATGLKPLKSKAK